MTNNKAEFCLKAAELHLQRAIALAGTEWKVSLAFWAALLASGVSFIGYTSASSPPMTVYIAHSDILFLIPYLLISGIFIFGFSVNQAQSIIQERTHYRYYLNEAAIAVHHSHRLADADPEKLKPITSSNRVWAVKLLSTFLVVTGIWGAAQWLAHGKLAAYAAIAAHPQHTPDLTRLPFGPGNVACAFFDCGDRGYFEVGDYPETGTIIWIIALVIVATFFARAISGGR